MERASRRGRRRSRSADGRGAVLRSLLRKPCGFEGLARIREALPTDDLAVFEGVELGMSLIHREPAVAPPAFAEEQDDLVVSRRGDLLELNRPVLPSLGPVRDVAEDRLVAPADLAI